MAGGGGGCRKVDYLVVPCVSQQHPFIPSPRVPYLQLEDTGLYETFLFL